MTDREQDLAAALDRVRQIHAPVEAVDYAANPARSRQVCAGCGTDSGNWQVWPCPTIRAIGAQR